MHLIDSIQKLANLLELPKMTSADRQSLFGWFIRHGSARGRRGWEWVTVGQRRRAGASHGGSSAGGVHLSYGASSLRRESGQKWFECSEARGTKLHRGGGNYTVGSGPKTQKFIVPLLAWE